MSEVKRINDSEVTRINDQLRRAFEGEAWHGPSVLELLKDVTASQAAARPIKDAHSIWELALHIAAWERVARTRITAGAYELPDEENFPKIGEPSESAWRAAIEGVKANHEALRSVIAGLEDSMLSETVPGTPYSVYFLLHGVVQHDLYHAGQIALLKKAQPQ